MRCSLPRRAPAAAPARRSEGAVTTRQWLHVFRKSIPAFAHAAACDEAVPAGARPAAVAAFAEQFGRVLDALEAAPAAAAVDGFVTAPLNCSTLCRVRWGAAGPRARACRAARG